MSEPYLVLSKARPEDEGGAGGEGEPDGQGDEADAAVERQVHAVQHADVGVGPLGLSLGVEADVGLGEAEAQEGKREHEGVRRLIDPVVRLPHKRKEHWRVDEVDEVLSYYIEVAKEHASLALARQVSYLSR